MFGLKSGWLSVLLLSASISSGCAAPPDVHPFAGATQSLVFAVDSTATAMRKEISAFDATRAEEFQQEWEHRIKAMEAMNDYAESLVAVVEAGNQGTQAAENVADSARQLLDTIGAAYPGGSMVANALSEGAVALYARFARHRAARTVAEALRDSDPAIEEVASVLAEDFETMKSVFQTLRTENEIEFITSSKLENPLIGYVDGLRDELRTLRDRLASEPGLLDQFLVLQDRIDHEQTRPGYVQYQAALAAIGERYDRHEELVEQAADLTRAWGNSHDQLIEAADSGITPGFQVLVEMSREMLEIYRNARRQE